MITPLKLRFILLGFALIPLLGFSQSPSVLGSFPKEGTKNIIRNAFISVVLKLPNGGLDPKTVNNTSVLLYPEGYPEETIPAFVTFKNDLRNITLEPYYLLQANAAYVFEITDKIADLSGEKMEPYKFTFTTGTVAFRKMITMNKSKAFGESLEEEEEEPIEEEVILASSEPFMTPAEKAVQKEKENRDNQVLNIATGSLMPEAYLDTEPIQASQQGVPPRASLLTATLSMADVLAIPDPYPDPPALSTLAANTPAPKIGSQTQAPGQVSRMESDLNEAELLKSLAEPVAVERKTYTIDWVNLNPNQFKYENELSPLYLPVPYSIATIASSLTMADITSIPDPIDLEDLPSADDLPSDEDLAGTSETVTEVGDGKETSGIINFPKGVIYKNQKLDIEFTFREKEYVMFVLRTYQGEKMLSESGYVQPGTRLRAVPMEGIPPGTYYAVVETANQKVTRKIVILD